MCNIDSFSSSNNNRGVSDAEIDETEIIVVCDIASRLELDSAL